MSHRGRFRGQYRLWPIIFACILAACISGPLQAANSTDRCHCFRDRTYDPEHRFAADDYLLTTVTNSLISWSFSIPKRRIVMMKMQGGIGNNDLLVGLHIAATLDIDIDRVIARKKDRAWQDYSRGLPQKDSLVRELAAGLPPDQAAEQIIGWMIDRRFSPAAGIIDRLRADGYLSPEIILTMTLATHADLPPLAITQLRKAGHSWSEITHNLGLGLSDTGKLALGSN